MCPWGSGGEVVRREFGGGEGEKVVEVDFPWEAAASYRVECKE